MIQTSINGKVQSVVSNWRFFWDITKDLLWVLIMNKGSSKYYDFQHKDVCWRFAFMKVRNKLFIKKETRESNI